MTVVAPENAPPTDFAAEPIDFTAEHQRNLLHKSGNTGTDGRKTSLERVRGSTETSRGLRRLRRQFGFKILQTLLGALQILGRRFQRVGGCLLFQLGLLQSDRRGLRLSGIRSVFLRSSVQLLLRGLYLHSGGFVFQQGIRVLLARLRHILF